MALRLPFRGRTPRPSVSMYPSARARSQLHTVTRSQHAVAVSPQLEALAAAARASGGTSDQGRQLHQAWQSLAFGYYAKIGECWNPAQFYSRSMSKLNILVGELDEDTGKVVPSEDERATRLFQPIQQAARGEGGLNASYGRLKFLIGEGRLCESRPPVDIEPDSAGLPPVIEFLSPVELSERENGRKIIRKAASGVQGIEYTNISRLEGAGEPEPGQMRMWRFWRRHPEYSEQADSPVRAVLDLYEQLWWVTMGERADIQSRIANTGVLLIPRELDLDNPTEAEQAAMSEDPELDPFMVRIGDAMMSAIGDPGSASAAVPPVIRGQAELLHPDVFRHLKFYDAQASFAASAREEALIRRVSIGLDLPIEEIMGLSMANHWTAWKIDEEKWAHIEPVAQAWCDDLYAAWLWPLLVANGVQNPERFRVMYDNTDLVTDPDKGKTAVVLHKDGVLNAEATLEANGFDTESAMSGEERTEWLAIQMRSLELLGIEPARPEQEEAPADEEEQPAEDAEPDSEDDATEDSFSMIQGLIEAAVDRSREVAGAKVRGMKRSCEDCFTGTEEAHNRDVIAVLGRDALERIGASPKQLVRGTSTTFLMTCERLHLNVPAELGAVVEHHAASTLHLAVPDPFPAEYLRELLNGHQ